MYIYEYENRAIHIEQYLFESNYIIEYRIALNEGIGDIISSIFDGIIGFFKKIIDFITGLFKSSSNTSSKIENITKKVKTAIYDDKPIDYDYKTYKQLTSKLTCSEWNVSVSIIEGLQYDLGYMIDDWLDSIDEYDPNKEADLNVLRMGQDEYAQKFSKHNEAINKVKPKIIQHAKEKDSSINEKTDSKQIINALMKHEENNKLINTNQIPDMVDTISNYEKEINKFADYYDKEIKALQDLIKRIDVYKKKVENSLNKKDNKEEWNNHLKKLQKNLNSISFCAKDAVYIQSMINSVACRIGSNYCGTVMEVTKKYPPK